MRSAVLGCCLLITIRPSALDCFLLEKTSNTETKCGAEKNWWAEIMRIRYIPFRSSLQNVIRMGWEPKHVDIIYWWARRRSPASNSWRQATIINSPEFKNKIRTETWRQVVPKSRLVIEPAYATSEKRNFLSSHLRDYSSGGLAPQVSQRSSLAAGCK